MTPYRAVNHPISTDTGKKTPYTDSKRKRRDQLDQYTETMVNHGRTLDSRNSGIAADIDTYTPATARSISLYGIVTGKGKGGSAV